MRTPQTEALWADPPVAPRRRGGVRIVLGHPLTIGASVGVASADSDDPDALLHNADVAMYEAKKRGKGTVAVHHR